jgi:hypothetical protein
MEKPQNENHQQNHFTTTATAAQQLQHLLNKQSNLT